MSNSYWQQSIGGLFALALVSALVGLLFSWGNPTALTTVIVVLSGALVLVAVLSRIREFSLGPKGVSAKLSKLEDNVQRTMEQVKGQETTICEQGKQLERQQELINDLVKYSMSASIFHHLCGIALLKKYTYHYGEADRREMYFLRDNGFIKPKSGGFLDFNETLSGKNLIDYAEPTEIGWFCVKLRKNEIPSNMLQDKDNLRIDPSTF